MSQEMSGSEKLKVKCQTIASLTPEEIAQVAGGASFGGTIIPTWLIRGIPVDRYVFNSQQLQMNELNINQQQF
ncbi:MAG: hypothetical protein KF888_01135 [Nitrosomonas sp.]|nr:hypothetical protein [Nitrosomonas sp.]